MEKASFAKAEMVGLANQGLRRLTSSISQKRQTCISSYFNDVAMWHGQKYSRTIKLTEIMPSIT